MFPARPFLLALPCIAAALWLAGCTRAPELDETRSDSLRQAAYPALIPLDQALATAPPEPGKAEKLQQELTARRARLQARARRLKAAEID